MPALLSGISSCSPAGRISDLNTSRIPSSLKLINAEFMLPRQEIPPGLVFRGHAEINLVARHETVWQRENTHWRRGISYFQIGPSRASANYLRPSSAETSCAQAYRAPAGTTERERFSFGTVTPCFCPRLPGTCRSANRYFQSCRLCLRYRVIHLTGFVQANSRNSSRARALRKSVNP